MPTPSRFKADYIRCVTRGGGYSPHQPKDRLGDSSLEKEFREKMERRKTRLLAERIPVKHPASITDAMLDCARRNIRQTAWGEAWHHDLMKAADFIVSQGSGYAQRMISALTPTSPYGFSCPHCIGKKSLEGAGAYIIDWTHEKPDILTCKLCGGTLPDAKFKEEGVLVCPRAGQTFTHFVNEREKQHPDDHSGQYAWHWVKKPTFVSFDGIVREKKILFMIAASRRLALAYRLTGSPKYAVPVVEILTRLADCVGSWLYHDFFGTYADCDPLYAAWHWNSLELFWKRHPNTIAYTGGANYETGPVEDDLHRAKMLATYFGSGRVHPSADCWLLESLLPAYDLVYDARDPQGNSLWTDETRAHVERDLLIEYLMGAEPYLGGAGKAKETNNKAPYVYSPMADAAQCLGLANYGRVALAGYEAMLKKSFLPDGMSTESPSYTCMFLNRLIWIPEKLHGLKLARNQKPVDVFRTDRRLRQVLAAQRNTLRPDGRLLPLSDTSVLSSSPTHVFEIGLKRYPDIFAGSMPAIYRAQKRHGADSDQLIKPSEYALFHHQTKDLADDRGLDAPEAFFPDWMTAIMRHGSGPDAAVLAMPVSPPGIHRHRDNLTIYYSQAGVPVLGEQGYVGDTKQIDWAHATASHNLVIVDDKEQIFAPWWFGPGTRKTNLRLCAASPLASVVEGESTAYPQCPRYRRLVAMLKGPGAETVAVDLFRVTGGQKHAYRLFSELGASDSPGASRQFVGIDLKEPALPDFGKSDRDEHVYGVLHGAAFKNPPESWQVIWSDGAKSGKSTQPGRSFRVWALSAADEVIACNGPGQEATDQAGRRVRYLDIVRHAPHGGAALSSTFVALHEPMLSGAPRVLSAERLPVPREAGPDAVAVNIKTAWGQYVLLSEFKNQAVVSGIRFEGQLAILKLDAECNPVEQLSIAARTLRCETSAKFGFDNAASCWSGKIVESDEHSLRASTQRPRGWPVIVPGVSSYVLVGARGSRTGYAVDSCTATTLRTSRFPLRKAGQFEWPAVRWWQAPHAKKK